MSARRSHHTAAPYPGAFGRGARRAVLAGSALLLGLPGCEWMCSKKTPAKPAATEIVAPRVELLTPGSEPRVRLEVGRWSGLQYQLESRTDGSFGLQGRAPTKTPTSVLRSHFEVVRGTADPVSREHDGREVRLVEERGELVHIGLESQTMPAEALAQLNAAFGLLKGLTTRSFVAEDGEVVEVKTESIAGVQPPAPVKKVLDDALDAQRHFPFRLPPEPVGVGAKWRFSEPFEVRGVKATQVADMTLLEVGKGLVRIAIRTRHQAPRQEVPHPTEPGLTATLEALRGDSNGEISVDPLTAYLLSARLTATSYLTMKWTDAAGQPQSATFMEARVQRLSGHVGAVAEAGAEAEVDAAPAGDAGSLAGDAASAGTIDDEP